MRWLCTILLTVPVLALAQPKIGYVDMKRLLDNSPQILEGKNRLSDEFKQRYEDIQNDEKRLSQLEDSQQRDGPFLSAEDRDTLEREVRALRRNIRRDREDFREEMNFRRNQELQEFEEKINHAVQTIAKEQGYDLLLSSPVIYASERIDITDSVLRRLKSNPANNPPSP